jgi:hypothetical protein
VGKVRLAGAEAVEVEEEGVVKAVEMEGVGTERGVRTMTTDIRATFSSRRMPKRTMVSSLLLSASARV